MNDTTRPNWTLILNLVTFALTLLTGGIVFGEMRGQVNRNADDIAQIQADNRNNAATLAEIKDTTTIIKTKLEILLPTTPPENRR